MAIRPSLVADGEAVVNSGRATVQLYEDGLICVSTQISPETAVSLGIPQPIGGWWSDEGLESRMVEAWYHDGMWSLEGPMTMYHRGYVLRRLVALASADMAPKLRKKLRAMARGYERAHRALKDGGCV
jgi:hypothetical protein